MYKHQYSGNGYIDIIYPKKYLLNWKQDIVQTWEECQTFAPQVINALEIIKQKHDLFVEKPSLYISRNQDARYDLFIDAGSTLVYMAAFPDYGGAPPKLEYGTVCVD